MRTRRLLFGFIGFVAPALAHAAEPGPTWRTEGPKVDAGDFSLEVPIEVLSSKVFLTVEVGGKPRRFVFDTGSPSMVSSELAEELQLKAVDKRQGRDSHGTVIETTVAQTDLSVGGTTFRHVPVYVAPFPKTARCLFDGVLGSEVLPLCAWQLDLPDGVLRCGTDLTALDHVGAAHKQPLYDFGYPHAPILDVRFARNAASKAMFDTGSPEYLAISPADLAGAERNDAVAKTIEGFGSLGSSLGGPAPKAKQRMVELRSLSLGPLKLGRIAAPVRESSPSLIGAAVLDHFVVTLDMRDQAAYFAPYRDGPFVREGYGLAMDLDDGQRVSLVWDDGPASEAGLRAGDRVISLNGEPVKTSCDGIRRTMQAVSTGDELEIEWENGAATLRRESMLEGDR